MELLLGMAVFSRIMAAIVGGYLFTTVMSLLLVLLFIDHSEMLAVQQSNTISRDFILSISSSISISVLTSFAIYTSAVLWVFNTHSASCAWVGMLFPSFIGIGIMYILLPPSLINSMQGL